MKKVLKYSGVLLIVCGVVLIAITTYVHIDYSSRMNKLLEDRVVLDESDDTEPVDSDSNTTDSENIEDDLADFSIEVLDSDQKVAEIKTGTPVITIPSLKITVPVINGTDSASLKLGAGKFEHSVDMGEMGNFAVAGHSSTIYNCIFNDLESIELLDEIICYNDKGVEFKYYVTNMFKTNPDNIDVTFSSNEATLTIVTCTDNGTRRFIVTGKLMSDEEFKDYKDSLEEVLISKAIELADYESDINILTYLQSGSSLSKIPYRVKYLVKDDCKPFFTNYVLSEDRLKTNEHEYFFGFNNPIGFNFNEIILEVIKSDL